MDYEIYRFNPTIQVTVYPQIDVFHVDFEQPPPITTKDGSKIQIELKKHIYDLNDMSDQ